jgi:hypothetical protein
MELPYERLSTNTNIDHIPLKLAYLDAEPKSFYKNNVSEVENSVDNSNEYPYHVPYNATTPIFQYILIGILCIFIAAVFVFIIYYFLIRDRRGRDRSRTRTNLFD